MLKVTDASMTIIV